MKLLTGFQNMREKLMALKGEIDKLKTKDFDTLFSVVRW